VHARDSRVVRVKQSHSAALRNCLRWRPLLGASEEGAERAASAKVKLHERARCVAIFKEDRLEAQDVRVGRKLREQRALTLQGTRLPLDGEGKLFEHHSLAAKQEGTDRVARRAGACICGLRPRNLHIVSSGALDDHATERELLVRRHVGE
jgi:hypothetical protein